MGGGGREVHDGAGGVAALADKGFGAWFHAFEVVGDEKQLHGCFVGVLDDDLELPFFGDAVAPPWRGTGGGRAPSLLLETALREL